jgi:hypothetical protein
MRKPYVRRNKAIVSDDQVTNFILVEA